MENKILLDKGKIDGWLKNKTSPHFDRPITFFKERERLEKNIKKDNVIDLYNFLSDPKNISQHAFYPFIGYNIIERKRSRIKQNKSPIKSRPIRYASHKDGYIYAYYAHKLSKIYEQKIVDLGLDEIVSAYRKSRDGIESKNNITMAKEVFSEISKRENNCIALAFDIESFYDSIDHNKLKQEWENLLNPLGDSNYRLPDDMYNVYKSLTNYQYVEVTDLCPYLRNIKNNNACYCNKCEPVDKKHFIKLKLPSPIFDTANEYRKFRCWLKERFKAEGLTKTFQINEGIKDPTNSYGIPQGSSMSALLSNIYMIPFDLKIQKLAKDLGGMYRRYSDDIIFICRKDQRDEVQEKIKSAILERGDNLKIHPIEDDKPNSKSQCYDFTSEKIKRKPLKYLGFSFDGEAVSIREESLDRYLRKSKRGISSARKGAEINLIKRYQNHLPFEEKHTKIFRRKINERYTHLGSRNFISYANRSFEEMDDSSIKRQVKKHFDRVQNLLKIEDKKLKEFLKNEEYKKKKK
jgi:hypothetical protein